MRWAQALPAAALALVAGQIATSPELRGVYLRDLAAKRRHLVQPYAVTLGDSHLALGSGWCWRLRHDPLGCVELADGGMTLRQVSMRADRAMEMRPRWFLVDGGTNDILDGRTDAPAFAAEFERLLRRLRSSGAGVIVMSVPPLADAGLSRTAARFNAALRPAAARAGARYLDLWPAAAAQGRLRPGLTVDGIHFRPAFYATWTELLRLHLAG